MDRAEHVCSAGSSDVNLFRNGEGIIDLDTEVPDSAFDLGVTDFKLFGADPGFAVTVPFGSERATAAAARHMCFILISPVGLIVYE